MKLVIQLFDQHAAFLHRRGAYVSQSAVTGHDLTSLDTHTGLPYELEHEIYQRYHGFDRPLRLPADIWQDLSVFADGLPLALSSIEADNLQKGSLNAEAVEFTPGLCAYTTSPRLVRRHLIAETIQPVFAPFRTLDWRFGLIQIDHLEGPLHISSSSGKSPMAPSRGLELPSIFEKTCVANAGNDEKRRDNQPPPCTSGSIDLGYGVIHLYKEPQDVLDDAESDDVEVRSRAGSISKRWLHAASEHALAGQGTMVAVLAVPANWATADFLQYIDSTIDTIEQMRIMRDAMPNRYMVLVKFHTAADVNTFIQLYDAQPYSSMLLDEVCHVVRISAVEITASSTPPYTYAFPQTGPEFGDRSTAQGLTELPTCPVCLERMDGTISGLITVQCSHTFHCMCLKGWSNNNCPVCRYSQGRTRHDHGMLGSRHNQCAVCAASDALWMCLICGHVGCGRFSKKHAEAHFEETGHTFAYELETQRVWDYAGDQYVHRLIQSKTDGKLVELPSSSAVSVTGRKAGPHGIASDEISKIEAMSIEFSDLMFIQLESQRAYYADRVARLKADVVAADKRRDAAREEIGMLRYELSQMREQNHIRAQHKESMSSEVLQRLKQVEEEALPALQREKIRTELKLSKATDLARTLHKDLDSERSVTKGLVDNVNALKAENEKRVAEGGELKAQIADLNEQIQDLMFTLTAQARIEEEGGAGGDVVVKPLASSSSKASPSRRKKK